MKSIVAVFFALVTISCCVPMPSGSSKESISNEEEHIWTNHDFGPSVTPYTQTMKPRVRTILVPPLWINTTWMEIVNQMSTESPFEEENSKVVSEDNENYSEAHDDDNMV